MTRAESPSTWPIVLAGAALVSAALLMLAAAGLYVAARTGDGWAWLGYYYAAGIAVFEVPAIVLACVALRVSRTARGRGGVTPDTTANVSAGVKGNVTAVVAAVLVPCPLLVWGLWNSFS